MIPRQTRKTRWCARAHIRRHRYSLRRGATTRRRSRRGAAATDVFTLVFARSSRLCEVRWRLGWPFFSAHITPDCAFRAAQPSWYSSPTNRADRGKLVTASRGAITRPVLSRSRLTLEVLRTETHGGARLLRAFWHAGKYRRVLPPVRVEKKSPGSLVLSLSCSLALSLSLSRACVISWTRRFSSVPVIGSLIGDQVRANRLVSRREIEDNQADGGARLSVPVYPCGHCL